MNINALHILQHPLLAAKAKKEAEEKRLAEKAQKIKESEMKLTYGKIPADIMKQEDELEGRATHRDPARKKMRPQARPMMKQGKGIAVEQSLERQVESAQALDLNSEEWDIVLHALRNYKMAHPTQSALLPLIHKISRVIEADQYPQKENF